MLVSGVIFVNIKLIAPKSYSKMFATLSYWGDER